MNEATNEPEGVNVLCTGVDRWTVDVAKGVSQPGRWVRLALRFPDGAGMDPLGLMLGLDDALAIAAALRQQAEAATRREAERLL
jgi:hypothetical protein